MYNSSSTICFVSLIFLNQVCSGQGTWASWNYCTVPVGMRPWPPQIKRNSFSFFWLPLRHSELFLAEREHTDLRFCRVRGVAGVGEDKCFRSIEGGAHTIIHQRKMLALKKATNLVRKPLWCIDDRWAFIS